jgi:hypothetical protein
MPTSRGRALAGFWPRLLAIGIAITWSAVPATGVAQRPSTGIDRAVAAFDEADFARALSLLDGVLASERLAASELSQVLSIRARIYFALDRSGDARDAISHLLAVAPTSSIPSDASPRYRALFESVRASARPLGIRADAERDDREIRLTASLEGGALGLVRTIAWHVRVDAGEWQALEGASVVVPAPREARVSYFVEALAPGAVVIASEGTRASPTIDAVRADTDTDTEIELGIEPSPAASDDTWTWVGVGTGIGLLAAGGIVLAVVLATARTETTLGPPMLAP